MKTTRDFIFILVSSVEKTTSNTVLTGRKVFSDLILYFCDSVQILNGYFK